MADEKARDVIARALRSDEWMERHFGIAAHAGDVAGAVVAALEAAGYVLLPPGEVGTEWGTRVIFPPHSDRDPIDEGPHGDDREDAMRYGRECEARGFTLAALLTRQATRWPGSESVVYTPWQVVEP